jgi:glycerophosphoryl diester phosphodiesterase
MITLLLAQAALIILPNAHSHNDYAQKRPLLEALDNGFMSMEVDIFLVDGELRVGHDRSDLKAGRTIESMYLDPLADRVKQQGGTVYGQPGTLILLVDIKEDGRKVQSELTKRLPKYRSMLSERTGSTVQARAVQVILSGARTEDCAQPDGFLFKDGRPNNLEDEASRTPMISESYSTLVGSIASPMPPAGKIAFDTLRDEAVGKGMIVRLWGAPDMVTMWNEFRQPGVLINTDHLKELRAFLLAK